MNNIIGALIVSLSLGGVTPVTEKVDPSDYLPSIEADGSIVMGPTEAEKKAEEERLKREEERLLKKQKEQKRKERDRRNLQRTLQISTMTTI